MIRLSAGGQCKVHANEVDQIIEKEKQHRSIEQDASQNIQQHDEVQDVEEPLQFNTPPLKQVHKDAN